MPLTGTGEAENQRKTKRLSGQSSSNNSLHRSNNFLRQSSDARVRNDSGAKSKLQIVVNSVFRTCKVPNEINK